MRARLQAPPPSRSSHAPFLHATRLQYVVPPPRRACALPPRPRKCSAGSDPCEERSRGGRTRWRRPSAAAGNGASGGPNPPSPLPPPGPEPGRVVPGGAKLAELGRGGGGAAAMRSQCVLGLRSFAAFAARLWSFVLYVLRRQVRTVSTGGAPGGVVDRKSVV